MTIRPAAVVVLAAGEGTRMKSRTPKVLHQIGGRSLIGHALAAAAALEPEHLVTVIGHGREAVRDHLSEIAPTVLPVVQDQQLGTGHAVRCALDALPPLTGVVVVTYGDVPLLVGDTLRDLVEQHVSDGNVVTVLTAEVADPTGYGRIIRDAEGGVLGIVEHKDASPSQRAVGEINSGIYAFDAGVLQAGLQRITSNNSQGEYYLTDVVEIARSAGGRVGALTVDDPWQTEGVNDRAQLATLHRELNRRILDEWMRAGVTVIDPQTTWIDSEVRLERDVTLLPNVQLHGTTSIAEGATVGPDTTLADCEVGPGASVIRTHATGASIGAEATVGPFTYLRPGTVLEARAKAGAYVEIKASRVGEGAKVPHLSYVGDAEIGEHSNIGAATVFVNYDGVAKHRTVVGSHARVGSDTMLVAPVTIGDGAYTAAGSVITEDVPAGAMGVARGRQRNVEGWVERRRPGTPAAAAAARARSLQAGDAERTAGSTTQETGQNEGSQP